LTYVFLYIQKHRANRLQCIGVGCPYEQSSSQSTRPDEFFSALNDVKKYSNIGIAEIIQQIQEKADIMPIKFPEEFGDF
jgi:hypothetical protein